MNGNIFLRTSVVFLCLGVALGVFMGATENFAQMPTHAHINLVAGVWMFLAGLYYNATPSLSRKAIMAHYWLALVGLLLFIPGIWGAQSQAAWYKPVVGIGSLLTAAQMVFFTVMVFLGTGKKAVFTAS